MIEFVIRCGVVVCLVFLFGPFIVGYCIRKANMERYRMFKAASKEAEKEERKDTVE